MPRPRKDSRALNINLRTDLMEELEAYSEEVGQTKTMAIERILQMFFEKRDHIKKETVRK